MTKEEINKKIEALETADFYLQMKDHWSLSDYNQHGEYRDKIDELKKMLEVQK